MSLILLILSFACYPFDSDDGTVAIDISAKETDTFIVLCGSNELLVPPLRGPGLVSIRRDRQSMGLVEVLWIQGHLSSDSDNTLIRYDDIKTVSVGQECSVTRVTR